MQLRSDTPAVIIHSPAHFSPGWGCSQSSHINEAQLLLTDLVMSPEAKMADWLIRLYDTHSGCEMGEFNPILLIYMGTPVFLLLFFSL